MAKKVFYGEDASKRVLEGAREVYDAVKVTMGPKGRNVIIEKGYGSPTVTHDGVTVAKAIEVEAKPKDAEALGRSVGAELIKQAANKTNDTVGDGTTTATILAYQIMSQAMIASSSMNPMDIKKGLDKVSAQVLS